MSTSMSDDDTGDDVEGYAYSNHTSKSLRNRSTRSRSRSHDSGSTCNRSRSTSKPQNPRSSRNRSLSNSVSPNRSRRQRRSLSTRRSRSKSKSKRSTSKPRSPRSIRNRSSSNSVSPNRSRSQRRSLSTRRSRSKSKSKRWTSKPRSRSHSRIRQSPSNTSYRRSRSKTRRSRSRSQRSRSRSKRRSRSRSRSQRSRSRSKHRSRSRSVERRRYRSNGSKSRSWISERGRSSSLDERSPSQSFGLQQKSKSIDEGDAGRVTQRMWNVCTTTSKSYKFLNVHTKMTTKLFFEKIASLFQLKQKFISVAFRLQSYESEEIEMEIEEGDEEGFQHAIQILPNYSKLTVGLRVTKMPEVSTAADLKRTTRTKEVITEQIKREMGLHTDEGKGKRGYRDAQWSDKCTELMKKDSRYLFDFDKLRDGVKRALGDTQFLINPFQMLCPICGNILCLGAMNQLGAVTRHIDNKHKDDLYAMNCRKRLEAWVENHFITEEQLNDKAPLPDKLISISSELRSQVEAAALTRDNP